MLLTLRQFVRGFVKYIIAQNCDSPKGGLARDSKRRPFGILASGRLAMAETGKPKGARQRRCGTRWRDHFLEYLAESSNISKSATRAGVSTARLYRERQQNPQFARDWLAALAEGYVQLEMEVLRRLREGDQQTSQGDRYDFGNALRLLAAHRENAAHAAAQQRNVSAAEVRASIDRKVEAIRQRLEQEKNRKAKEA
jgi:hypothetical protein